jgi:hypothetical protein
MKGVATVESGKAATVRFDLVETQVARTLEYLLAMPSSPDTVALLSSPTLSASLRTFITTYTGYDPDTNTWGKLTEDLPFEPVDPRFFRARLLAEQLADVGVDVLNFSFRDEKPTIAQRFLATPAVYSLDVQVPTDSQFLGADTPYARLCGPVDQDGADLTNASTYKVLKASPVTIAGRFDDVPAGTYEVAVWCPKVFTDLDKPRMTWTWLPLTVEEQLPNLEGRLPDGSPTNIVVPVQIPVGESPFADGYPSAEQMQVTGLTDTGTLMGVARNPKDHLLYEIYRTVTRPGMSQDLTFWKLTPTNVGTYAAALVSTRPTDYAEMSHLSFDADGNLYYLSNPSGTPNALSVLPASDSHSWRTLVYVGDESVDDPVPSEDTMATMGQTYDIAVDPTTTGRIYLANAFPSSLRRVTVTFDENGPGSEVSVTTVAGLAPHAFDPSEPAFRDGAGQTARFSALANLLVRPDGSLDGFDAFPARIRHIKPIGDSSTLVSTLAGSMSGYADGTGSAALLGFPPEPSASPMAVDKDGNLYVFDSGNGLIRKITPAGVVSTFFDVSGSNRPEAFSVDADGFLTWVDPKAPTVVNSIPLTPPPAKR